MNREKFEEQRRILKNLYDGVAAEPVPKWLSDTLDKRR